jgi:propanol-preferring alcohol dehydrogenase
MWRFADARSRVRVITYAAAAAMRGECGRVNAESLPTAMPSPRTQAMRLSGVRMPLEMQEVALPPLGDHDLLLEVAACGVCRTDLHLIDGELPQARYPITPGHEIVGRVRAAGRAVRGFAAGDRVGVPWLASTCGRCRYCRSGAENLCEQPAFTGCHVDGGYARHAVADARFCLRIPAEYGDAEAAPLLCAGLIGHRAWRACGDAPSVALYGFGAAAHLLAQVARAQRRRIFAFTRPGDAEAQAHARELGAEWAGGSDQSPPEPLDAAIIFAPVGALIPAALRAVRPGGRVVCAGIHMSDVPAFPYELLWGERSLSSIANLTREDGREFMRLAAQIRLHPEVTSYPLERANQAVLAAREGRLRGAAVLVCDQEA